MIAAPSPASVVVRDLRESDRPYVFSRWLHAYRGSPFAREAGRSYWQGHHDVVERLLERATWRVAAWAEDDEIIAGFLCRAGDVLHFVFVETAHRRGGVAKTLLAELPETCKTYSHRPTVPITVPDGWAYDPYAMWRI